MDTIKLQLSNDLKIALKKRDAIAIKTIRSLMAALDNAEAVQVAAPETMPMAGGIAGATDGLGSSDVPRKELAKEDIRKIIQNEIDEIENTINLLKKYSRPEVEELAIQMNLLKKYL